MASLHGITVPHSKGSGGNSLHVYKTSHLGRIRSKASQFIHSPSKKPSKDLLPYLLDGLWTFPQPQD